MSEIQLTYRDIKLHVATIMFKNNKKYPMDFSHNEISEKAVANNVKDNYIHEYVVFDKHEVNNDMDFPSPFGEYAIHT